VHQAPKRSDITVYEVAASEIATELGNSRVANIVMLGAFVRATGIIVSENVEKVIRDVFGEKKAELLDLELKAYHSWKQ
jgi:2-oxoglutarate ferredoxin oxidoreductase subunit gamma